MFLRATLTGHDHSGVPISGSLYRGPHIPLTLTVIYQQLAIALNNYSTNNWIKQHKGVVLPQEGVTINFVRMNEILQNTILIEFISLLFMTPS